MYAEYIYFQGNLFKLLLENLHTFNITDILSLCSQHLYTYIHAKTQIPINIINSTRLEI